MAESDLTEVSELHYKSLPGIPTSIGIDYIKLLYQLLLKYNNLHICYVCVEDKKIQGVITVSRDIKKTHQLLNKLLFNPHIIFILISNIVFGYISIKDIFYRKLFELKAERILPMKTVSIFTIYVNDKYRGKGIGKKLIQTVIKELKNKMIVDIYVDSRKENKNALDFYKSAGFNILLSAFDAVLLSKKIT